jgi:hypothetical protein
MASLRLGTEGIQQPLNSRGLMSGAEFAAYHESTAILSTVEGDAVGTNSPRGPLPARAQANQRQAGMAEPAHFPEEVEGTSGRGPVRGHAAERSSP